jgi:hypothetical protein
VCTKVLGLRVKEGRWRPGWWRLTGPSSKPTVRVSSNRTRRRLVDEILSEQKPSTPKRTPGWGDRQGDELPERWADRRGRGFRLREALRQLDGEGPSDPESPQAAREAKEFELGRKLPGRSSAAAYQWQHRSG